MRILFLDWPCFGKVDTQFTLEQAGHEFVPFFHLDYQERESTAFDDALHNLLEIPITIAVFLSIISQLSPTIVRNSE